MIAVGILYVATTGLVLYVVGAEMVEPDLRAPLVLGWAAIGVLLATAAILAGRRAD